jgi:surface antigen
MGKYAKNVVEQAKAWVGKNEKDGSHKEIIDVYNSHKPLARGYKVKYTDAWCAAFVSAVAIKVGYTAIIPTECSCNKMIDLFKKLGEWVEDDARKPNIGDVLFYDWDDSGKGDNKNRADHVGIVEKVDGDTITVIEGNYSNSVKRRSIKVNGKNIRGYGVPKYDAEPVVEAKTVTQLAREVLKGKWGNGAERKKRLTEAGYDYTAVQKEVNRLCNSSKTTSKKSNEEIAKEVIKGKWGNGQDRKNRLKAAGYDPSAIQKIVNKLMK